MPRIRLRILLGFNRVERPFLGGSVIRAFPNRLRGTIVKAQSTVQSSEDCWRENTVGRVQES